MSPSTSRNNVRPAPRLSSSLCLFSVASVPWESNQGGVNHWRSHTITWQKSMI